jgi:hypothetical protein
MKQAAMWDRESRMVFNLSDSAIMAVGPSEWREKIKEEFACHVPMDACYHKMNGLDGPIDGLFVDQE